MREEKLKKLLDLKKNEIGDGVWRRRKRTRRGVSDESFGEMRVLFSQLSALGVLVFLFLFYFYLKKKHFDILRVRLIVRIG
jgi:hypothetical protein